MTRSYKKIYKCPCCGKPYKVEGFYINHINKCLKRCIICKGLLTCTDRHHHFEDGKTICDKVRCLKEHFGEDWIKGFRSLKNGGCRFPCEKGCRK